MRDMDLKMLTAVSNMNTAPVTQEETRSILTEETEMVEEPSTKRRTKK